MEQTFAIIKPDAVERNLIGAILEKIESKGFRKLIVEKDGQPEIIDNPKWEN